MRFAPLAFRAAGRTTRRGFVALVGAVAAQGRPAGKPARARPAGMPVVGYLGSESPEPFASRLAAFCKGLAETGYTQGRNVAMEFRWAEGRYDRLPALAADLAARGVTLIAAPGGAQVALAAKSAAAAIPVVFEMGGDPIALGVVGSLSRPGGNVTGVSSLSVEVSHKRLEFMRELLPAAEALAVAVNPTSPTAGSQLGSLRAAAESLGVRIHVLQASTEGEFEDLFTAASRGRAGGLVFTSDPYFAYRSRQLAVLAALHAMPTITQSRDFPMAGGLMSYGGDFEQSHRSAGIYAGRILRGEKPADLPVQQVTKVELFINLRAADALGVGFPPSLLGGADTVVE